MAIHDTNALTAFDGFLEPVDEREPRPPSEPTGKKPKPGPSDAVSVAKAADFRPRLRPAIPVLVVLDDNQRTGEKIRIRKSPFRIGRVEGDLTIPLDGQLSSVHAELCLHRVNGRAIWNLKDLNSKNGTFVRAKTLNLRPQQVFLLGASRFRFEPPQAEATTSPEFAAERTQQWQHPVASPHHSTASLVRLDVPEEAARIPLLRAEQWLGRDPAQASIVIDDPLLEAQHARFVFDPKSGWRAECRGTVNGLWVQIQELSFENEGCFQCGEQRFQFHPAWSEE